MTHLSALQAIAVSSEEQQATWCESTLENISFLLLVCSKAWSEDGVGVFVCTEQGNEWTVKIVEDSE